MQPARPIEETLEFQPRYDDAGLIPAFVTDAASGHALMVAWMNAETLALTISRGEAHFWSRSRRKVWRKGEESGNILRVIEIRTDCDQDALWLRVAVAGAGNACHTGRQTCFYRVVSSESDLVLAPVAESQ